MSNEKCKMTHVSITLSDNALRVLDKFADDKSLTRSSVIRLLIIEKLSKKTGVLEN
jgi:metal-responsive CopG/Arc/MetJ family transcriptional regulator